MGLSYDRPARQMKEYLEIAGPMLEGQGMNYQGEIYTTRWRGCRMRPPPRSSWPPWGRSCWGTPGA